MQVKTQEQLKLQLHEHRREAASRTAYAEAEASGSLPPQAEFKSAQVLVLSGSTISQQAIY